ncbi:MAG: tRNA preQ1(34) S-adenosylmethionine ribosyltransferase-isomerase QueA [Sphingomonadales bacterium]|nr:tRNA preQ1(34) S-adenosylmethionine ribosyltransferase-isomerase QueA [Sphingomonadales bacterium]
MLVSDFDFELPKERIALYPAEPRDSARMLVVGEGGHMADEGVRDLLSHLRSGDVLVMNDTRVIPARLKGKRGEAKIEVTLHKRIDNSTWAVFARPAKKLRVGDEVNFDGLLADVVEKRDAGEVILRFQTDDAMSAIEGVGEMPLPPYIASQRIEGNEDKATYQTVYAREKGAVAAPTAGLHFTPELLEAIRAKGVEIVFLTLHVGAGTFLPVKVDDVKDHKMHAEWGEITPDNAEKLNKARSQGRRIVAVGTTSLRLLESAASDDGVVHPFKDETAIFITPGYRFKAVDLLMTNFHLPKSTLFMLVSAFAGADEMKAAYGHAIDNGYRFYSYGDASLLYPKANEQ